MQDDVASLHAYSRWADDRVLAVCRKLTRQQYIAEPIPGWSSVRSTIVHIAVVTQGWLRGVKAEVANEFPAEAAMLTVDDVALLLDQAHQIFADLLRTFTAENLAPPHTFSGRG